MSWLDNLYNQIREIAGSVVAGKSLTPEQYEVLASSSENQTKAAVGERKALLIEMAYNHYTAQENGRRWEEKSSREHEGKTLVLHDDGMGNEWYNYE